MVFQVQADRELVFLYHFLTSVDDSIKRFSTLSIFVVEVNIWCSIKTTDESKRITRAFYTISSRLKARKLEFVHKVLSSVRKIP